MTAVALYDDDLDFELSRELLARRGIELRRLASATPRERDVAVGLLCSFRSLTDRDLARLPSLRVISLSASDSPNLDMAAARRRGITVTTVPDASTEEVALHSLALILSGLRAIPILERRVRSGDFSYADLGSMRVASSLTLGIVGCGRVGGTLARMAEGLFGGVLLSDVRELPGDLARGRQVDLGRLLELSDVVSLHVGGHAAAMPVIDRAAFRAMRRGAVFVNTARAHLVDELALLDALDRDRIAFAGLDVVSDARSETARRLIAHERCVVTPHCAFFSARTRDAYVNRQAELLVDAIDRAPVGERALLGAEAA